MRLDKYLSDMSIGTRKEVKEFIKKGRVSVNDVIIKKSDYKLNDNDVVRFDNEVVTYVNYEYYLLNKPAGYLSALDDPKHPCVIELITSKRKDLALVGRLDLDTEGALLITNDGILNHHLLSPKYHVLKTYYVEVDTDLIDNAKEILENGIEFSDFTTKTAKYEEITKRSAYLTISEGKFHQVKRMFAHIGANVTYLKRVKFANLTLDGLEIGEYRHLTNDEIAYLYKITGLKEED